MKKLFSAMLAATMVAGTAVTAFAATANTAVTDNKGFDFALIGAYTDEGGKLEEANQKNKIDGGDKLYFPILVSGEELLDQKDNATDDAGAGVTPKQMYFATKASEVKDLKASVKDEVGGKYIDDAAIVKKDIKITAAGDENYVDGFANNTVAAADVQAKLGAGFSVTGSDLTGGKTDAAAAPSGLTINKLSKVDVANVTVEYKKAAAGSASNGSVTASYTSGTDTVAIVITGKNPYTGSSDSYEDFTATAAAIQSELGAGFSVTGSDLTGGTTDVAAAPATLTIKRDVTTPIAGGSTVEYKKAAAGSASNGSFTASYDATNDKVTIVVTGKNANATSGSALNTKVYCVEVKMADYFKAEETEVEFNIKLKDGGRVAFDTEDDKLAYFNGTFDLGKDTETLSAHPSKKTAVKGVEVKKFKKGEIEILIGKDTRSVQLDEAFESDGTTKEDITNIYIENDKTIDDAFTFDVKASSQDDLYLELNQDAVKDLAVSNQKADLTFFNFPGNPEFDFSGKATFAVEDDDEDYFFYEIVDGELVETNAKYNDDDGVFELRTNKLTSYVISDKKLETAEEKEEANDEEKKDEEATGGEATDAVTPNPNGGKGNANTGAADLIGVASALAVVSVAAAGAVALKK